jgi:hypothetical protein
VLRDAMHAVTDLRFGFGMCCDLSPWLIGFQVARHRRAERASGRDRDKHPLRVRRVEKNRVQPQPAGAGRHVAPVPCLRSPASSLHVWPRSWSEQRGVFDPAYTVSGSVSDGSKCQTRLNSHGCGVPSYHCACRHPFVRKIVAGRFPVLPPSFERCTTWPNQLLDCEA